MTRNNRNNPTESDDIRLPDKLVADLRSLYPYPAAPTEEVEAEIRHAAREEIGNLRRHRRWGLWGSIAASIALVFVLQNVLWDSAKPKLVQETAREAPEIQLASRVPAEPESDLPAAKAKSSAPARRARSAPPPTAEADAMVITSAEDIDGNGRVDILDAFAIARGLAAEPVATKPAWDINHDGSIDQQDIDAVAQSAVRLKGGA